MSVENLPTAPGGLVVEWSVGRFIAPAAGMIVAGGIVAAVNSVAPFDRGSWLAAYLVLVGGVSQIALAAGEARLRREGEPAGVAAAKLALWNAGVLLVPAGVLADLPAAVSAGSIALLAALALFALGARRGGARPGRGLLAYYAIVVALAASVFVGSGLGGAPPGTW